MAKTGIIFHPDCLFHETGPGHPEKPERATAVIDALRKASFPEEPVWKTAQPASAESIDTIHTPEYRAYIEESSLCGRETVDFGETRISEDSFRVALLAAGGAIDAVTAVCSGEWEFAFSACRPPGHHARAEQAMGFCLFNNIAIAADYAERKLGIERIAVLDWDVHHGNGTQEAFYNSPSVHVCSVHQSPLYPHSGHRYETGSKAAKDMNLNLPLPAGSGLDDILRELEAEWVPALSRLQPDLILVSAGFDAHRLDPLADQILESEDFYRLTEFVCQQAQEHGSGRVVSVLEGGYHLEALAESAVEHVRAYLDW